MKVEVFGATRTGMDVKQYVPDEEASFFPVYADGEWIADFADKHAAIGYARALCRSDGSALVNQTYSKEPRS